MKKGSNVLSIIVTYNALRNDWIEKCLTSLAQSQHKTDIIVIDNASSDGTVEFIHNSFPNVNLVKSNINLGFGQANNIGLKKCLREDYNFAFLLNQDAWIEKDTIEKLVNASLKNQQYGVISPIHLNGKGDALDFNFSLHISPPNCERLYSDIFLKKTGGTIYPVNFTNAAAWLITRNCLNKVGGFSPSFFHYCEDDNYVHRLHYHQLKIGILPTVKIFHDRENRKINTFFNEMNNYKRRVVLESSNPNSTFSFNKECFKIFLSLFLKCLLLKFSSLKVPISKLYYLTSLNKKKISKNLNLSKVIGYSFLN